MSNPFYRAFEEKYRGSRDLIKSRLQVYLPFIQPLLKAYPAGRTLDVGCGRGEWLEIMGEEGFDAVGVDLDDCMLQACQERGLNVEIADAVNYIKGLPESSLCIVSGFHIAEHLPFDVLQQLVQEAKRVLVPGGLLILETPNPENISVGANSFYLDPTHQRPIPIGLLSFLMEYYGFARLKVLHLQENPNLLGDSQVGLMDVLEGVSPDFAVVAQKQGLTMLMEELTPVFDQHYGLTLHHLAHRYNQAIESRFSFIEAKLQQAQEKALQAEIKAQQAQEKALQAEIKAQQAQSQALQVNVSLKTICVDLTPVLPGGENGGAKIFVLELLRRLAEMAPQTQFILLTQASSHTELSILDRPNMRRVMVVGPEAANTLRLTLLGLASRLLPHFPVRLRGVLNRWGYKLNTALKRGGSGSLLHDMGIDLLFCPFTAPTYFEPGIPTVCTIYDLQYKTYPDFFTAEEVAHRERTFIEACRRAAALTAISDYSRDSAITHGSLDSERIRTIHLRMAQRILPGVEGGKAILKRLDLVPQRYLVYPANFWKHKNHEMLLAALGIACHEGLPADIKVVCTGAPGARQAWLINAARTMNLGNRILFPGYLPNTELSALIADSIGVVFPSLYEGFGLPVIEAMAAGVAVACSNTTSLPEVAEEAAILFDPRVPTQIAQAMISLVNNDVLRARLVQAGLQRAAEFSDTERMAREYWDLFQYALSNEKFENLLTGTYVDGWVGPRMSIQVAPEASAQTLELEFSAPEWLPQSSITIQTTLRGNSQGAPLELQRGTSSVLSLAVEPVGGCYEVVITPTFVPARSGNGDDQRELSVLLQRCGILRADGEYIELLPKKFPS